MSESDTATAKILEIYHDFSNNRDQLLTGTDLQTKPDILLAGMLNADVPLNIRIKLIEISGETAFPCFPSRLGNFLDCYLSILRAGMCELVNAESSSGKNSVLLVEAILRALVSLCHGSPAANQPHMVRELADALLQVAHVCHVISVEPYRLAAKSVEISRASTAVSKAMQKMPHLNFESVLVKVIHWINRNGRQEEKNQAIRQSEASFASKMLTRIIKDQLVQIRFNNNDVSGEQVRENMRKFFIRSLNAYEYLKSGDAIRSIWQNGLRRTALYDDERTTKLLSESMKKLTENPQDEGSHERSSETYFSSNLVFFEIILSECNIVKKLEADVILPYVQLMLVELDKIQQSNANLALQRDDIYRLAKVMTVLLGQSGKYTPATLETLFLQNHSWLFDTLNGYIENYNSSAGECIDVFYVEALLGQIVAFIDGCPVLLLKMMQIKRNGVDGAAFVDGPLNELIVPKVVRLIQSLRKLEASLTLPCHQEAVYASKKMAMQRDKYEAFPERFLHACSMVSRMTAGFLDASSHFPRGIAFSWEHGKNKKRVRSKEPEKENADKPSKLWIPTCVKENLNRQMLQF
ncbi:ABC transporter substrate-binding protein [Perkinsela sp. CCAP 1560/4]|nr:ABC transporter substrate-binding protein [Perkinsela sp. CCAP 1560/4]|eukprot:KNH05266.1 ABC transporter substrate-binding protein [Perkinsela sp. CCAP 1560/4]